jgi:hypothetical protein
MATKWTEPAPKYGPTAEYGECEAHGCRADARVTCIDCKAHVCHGHAAHERHDLARAT